MKMLEKNESSLNYLSEIRQVMSDDTCENEFSIHFIIRAVFLKLKASCHRAVNSIISRSHILNNHCMQQTDRDL